MQINAGTCCLHVESTVVNRSPSHCNALVWQFLRHAMTEKERKELMGSFLLYIDIFLLFFPCIIRKDRQTFIKTDRQTGKGEREREIDREKERERERERDREKEKPDHCDYTSLEDW